MCPCDGGEEEPEVASAYLGNAAAAALQPEWVQAQVAWAREGVEHKPPDCVKGKEHAKPHRLLCVGIGTVDVGALGAKGSWGYGAEEYHQNNWKRWTK